VDLILHVKSEYFDQMLHGNKPKEYRKVTPYWTKRLSQTYDRVVIAKGYPKRIDAALWLIFKYNGYTIEEIQHKEFDVDSTTEVYAIDISERIK
jgi:hypothetical protein